MTVDELQWAKEPGRRRKALDVLMGLLALAFFLFIIWVLGGLAVEAVRD